MCAVHSGGVRYLSSTFHSKSKIKQKKYLEYTKLTITFMKSRIGQQLYGIQRTLQDGKAANEKKSECAIHACLSVSVCRKKNIWQNLFFPEMPVDLTDSLKSHFFVVEVLSFPRR